ncbi:hypothetical protein HS088_TW23G00949 [Tripterygium wilfordii]|uniref:Uncharacterized protein n=1 Tax=Tripterygium wilfordii TaxID=458696 RepID=A0A7J7BWK0_TRIWF|nr:uncharacterized protein LOC119993397 [Tripterygium wilfordii]KAF5726208.1 hypothetical protein HS088_TW23G00949 [Tripterygium wilfordii]
MATSSRESRRRRIVERGSDRLALITGRIQNVPAPLSSSESVQELINIDRSQLLVPQDQEIQPSSTNQNNEPPNGEGEALSSMLLKGTYQSGSSVGLPLSEHVSSVGAPVDPSPHISSVEQSSLVMSADRTSSTPHSGTDWPVESQAHWLKNFNPKRITSAIAATETTRLFCSVAIALLVVSSHLGSLLLGSNIMEFIASFRPLHLVLLTNLTVVIYRLVFHKQRGAERPGRAENKILTTDDYGWAQQMSNALELGLLMKAAMDAMLIDCSVYLVLVICGISFT